MEMLIIGLIFCILIFISFLSWVIRKVISSSKKRQESFNEQKPITSKRFTAQKSKRRILKSRKVQSRSRNTDDNLHTSGYLDSSGCSGPSRGGDQDASSSSGCGSSSSSSGCGSSCGGGGGGGGD